MEAQREEHQRLLKANKSSTMGTTKLKDFDFANPNIGALGTRE
jgi:hypothetical protein